MTVAVLPVTEEIVAQFDERDVEWQAVRGSGKGGQARNKTSNCVILKHIGSGMVVRVETSRSQWQNRESAKRLLLARLTDDAGDRQASSVAQNRRDQVGSGMRGDKVRTVRMQDGSVVDHVTGRRTTTNRYLRGYVDDLF